MVLRLLVMLTLMMSTSLCLAADNFDDLDILYKLNDYENLLGEIGDLDGDITYKDDFKVYELKALVFESNKLYEKAVDIYRNLIKTNFKNETNALLRLIKKKEKKGREFPRRMFFYYVKIAENYTKLYESLPENYDRFKRAGLRAKIGSYLKITRTLDETNDTVMRLYNRLEEKDKVISDNKYLFHSFVFLSVVSWQDYFKVSNGAETAKVLNTTLGSCTGGGVGWVNIKYEWLLSGCLLLGKSTANTDEGDINFSQSKVSVSGNLVEIGVMTKAFADDLSFGIFTNILTRKGEWDTASGYTLSETSYTRIGYALKTKWNVGPWSFSMGLGKVFKNESSLLQIATIYNF